MSTIVAISTAPGIGGIGIVRLSGENCFEIIQKIFIPKIKQNIDSIKGYTIKYGHIVDPKTNETVDEVLVSYFKGPKSYTAENLCEISSHGGIVSTTKILEICLENGATLAEAGEFTKRAFLNGRIDLSQAEAVIDIINSKTDREVKTSIKQLKGFLSKEINKIKQELLNIMVDIEASIDYPEYDDIPEVEINRVLKVLNSVNESLRKLENTFNDGKIIKEGISTAIIGKTNAGKSSLLNAILKEERAIVTSYEGTTRDTIEEFVSIRGIPLKIIDTAGFRVTTDEVEKIGIEKGREIAENADLIIAMFDVTKKLTEEDEQILNFIKNKNAIIVFNKVDLGNNFLKQNNNINKLNKNIIEISALNRIGIEELFDEILKIFKINNINLDNELVITNTRHKNLIKVALNNTVNAINAVSNGMPIDMLSINIKEILEALGNITGDNVSEDIINEIFEKFCIGK